LSAGVETTDADSSNCGQNVYEAPAGTDTVTSEMAVAQWYSQKQYYNHDTGLATPGHETDAQEYIQVVYQDNESIGFGITAPYVVGWYCPKADMSSSAV